MNLVLLWAVRLLELLFAVGCCGSFIVIVLAGIEDLETIFARGDEPETQAVQPDS